MNILLREEKTDETGGGSQCSVGMARSGEEGLHENGKEETTKSMDR